MTQLIEKSLDYLFSPFGLEAPSENRQRMTYKVIR